MSIKFKYFFITLLLFLIPVLSYAQENRSYVIDSFDANIGIKKDSTVTIVEKITYNFTGEYHKGWRAISQKDIGKITDVYVVDSQTGERLKYSSSPLDKTDPANWGKYAITQTPGYINVEWYYNKANTQYAWEIHYVVHGSIGFYDTYDELYWNLFTEYEVPISSVTASIRFVDIPDPKTTQFAWYRTIPSSEGYFKADENGYFLKDSGIKANEAVTFAIGFPKGLIPQSAYWKDFLMIYWGLASALLLIFITLITIFTLWFRKEHVPKHNRSIVPQYDPPQNLKPAQMDIIYKENLSKKTWTATIIDLAVKGYVRIVEDKKDEGKFTKSKAMFIVVAFLWIGIFIYNTEEKMGLFVTILISIVFLFAIMYRIKKAKDYTIHLLNYKYQEDEKLDTYEKSFLRELMGASGYFSTAEMKVSPYRSRELFMNIKKIEEGILEEIESDYPGTYDSPLKLQSKRKIVSIVLVVLIFLTVMATIQGIFSIFSNQLGLTIIGLVVSFALYLYFIKYNPKLSHSGNETWRNIEGFKHYLKVAERYRLQNLTPEIFEKFLPYAMIFGVEKQWSKNFESIATQPPNWYSGGSAGLYSSTPGMGGGFSASVFSTSFATSFSSAFASSGGGGSSGGSGGGGSSGGGGGGGGGGAS